MRLAVDVTSLLDVSTGVAAVLRHHLAGLRSVEGVDVVPFAATWRGRDRLASIGVDHPPMPARPLRAAWQRSSHPRVERWTGPVDAVWGPNFVVPPARRGVRRVATVHDLTCIRYPELCTADVLAYPGLLRRALAGGAHLHVVSSFVGDEVVSLLGADPSQVHVVPNGIDPAPFVAASAARGRALAGGDGAPYVLAVGTIEPRKDHPTLVRAFDALAGAVGPELRLVLAGADGWGTAALDAALDASAAAADGRVLRLGWVPDADRADLLAGAAVLAYPSVYEGFGLPPLEAMAAGTPVVATAAGALPEVLGDAAALVPVGAADALAEALHQVLVDDAHRASLVARGRSLVDHRRWSGATSALVSLFH